MRTKIFTLLFSLLMGILPTFAQVQIPYYESFLGSSGEFSVTDVHRDSVLTYVWKNSNLYGMVASGYLAGNHNAESWLISPLISLPDTNNINLSFEQALKYEDHGVYDHIAVKISVNKGTSWTKNDRKCSICSTRVCWCLSNSRYMERFPFYSANIRAGH